ncbi:MAG: DUF3043 domain-containing protein, partial [Micrococcales bacterium]|nr:DUF3043 domain-containing protein [Micrococcales bacterium]
MPSDPIKKKTPSSKKTNAASDKGTKAVRSSKPAEKAGAGTKDASAGTSTKPQGQQSKGHATPSRKQTEQAKVRPIVGAAKRPNLTKEQRKEASRQARERYNHAMRTGEERFLPARDKGPIKRYIRDFIDAQRTLSEYFIWAVAGMLVLVIVIQQAFPGLAGIMALSMYLFFFAAVFD